jgi:hypothetical protein
MVPELFALLRSLELPIGDYAIFGSGPLLIRGIIDESGDLDVISRRAAWARARECGEIVHLGENGAEIVSCFGGLVTIGQSWAYGDFDLDELIDDAEMIDGLPFVRLEHVVAYKIAAGRQKDLEHLEMLARFDTALEDDR